MNQLKAGATLNYVILGLNAVVGLTYTPYMLRCLGQSEYGIYSLATAIIAYLSMLDLGFGNAVIRYTSKLRAEGETEEQYSLFGMFTVLYSVIGLLVIVAGVVLYFNLGAMFGDTMTEAELERTKVVTALMVVNLAFTFPLSIYGAIITAYENFVFLRVVQIVKLLLNTAVIVAFLYMGYKAVAMVIVHTAFNFAALGINYFYCRRKIRIKIDFGKPDWPLLREIAVYSFWIFLNAIMDRVYWSTGQFVLGATSGTVAISVYAVAIALHGYYMLFSTGIAGVFLPRITSMLSRKCTDSQISDLFIKVGRIQFAIMSVVLSGFLVFGRQFIDLWAGNGYGDSYIITVIFFVALFIPLVQNLGITILQARNQMKFRSLLYIVIAVVSLVFQVVLSRYYGGIGCAIAVGGALILGQGLVMNIYYHKVQKIDIVRFWAETLRMSVVPVVLTVCGYFAVQRFGGAGASSLAIGILVFLAIYMPLFYRFSLNDYERELFAAPLRKVLRLLR